MCVYELFLFITGKMKILPGIVLAIGTSLVMLNPKQITECASVPYGGIEVCIYVPHNSNMKYETGLFISWQYFDRKKFLIYLDLNG